MSWREWRPVVMFAALASSTVLLAAILANMTVIVPPETIDPADMSAAPQGPRVPNPCIDSPRIEACWGQVIYRSAGCVSCHSIDPAVRTPGPTWAQSFGTTRPLEGGLRVRVDRDYIRRSILTPDEDIALGYTVTRMNPYRLSDRQIDAIVAYFEELAALPSVVVAPTVER